MICISTRMLRSLRIYTDNLHADLRDYAGLRRDITTKSTKIEDRGLRQGFHRG